MPNPKTSLCAIPDGYAAIASSDYGHPYIVPQFTLPDLEPAFEAYYLKRSMETEMAERRSSQVLDRPFAYIGEDKIRAPPNPDLSNEERLNLHAEALALQERLGISYKDATHRMYMAEMEKLKAMDIMKKGLFNIRANMLKELKEFHSKYLGGHPVDPDSDSEDDKGKGKRKKGKSQGQGSADTIVTPTGTGEGSTLMTARAKKSFPATVAGPSTSNRRARDEVSGAGAGGHTSKRKSRDDEPGIDSAARKPKRKVREA